MFLLAGTGPFGVEDDVKHLDQCCQIVGQAGGHFHPVDKHWFSTKLPGGGYQPEGVEGQPRRECATDLD